MSKKEFLPFIFLGFMFFVWIILAVVLFTAGSPKNASSDYTYISDEDERFDAIYEDFISSYSYKKLSFKEKLGRFLGTSSLEARERKGGECWELCSILCSELRSSGFSCKICLGLDVPHTWIEVYLGGEWLTFDPTDDIYRYNHNRFWGVIRDYENFKKIRF